MRTLFVIVSISMVMTLASLAFAQSDSESSSPVGIFVEPAVTYETSNSSIHYPSPLSDSTGSLTGFGLGGRLGIHLSEIVFAGIDGRYSMPYFKDSSTNYGANATAANWGPVLGVQMPIVGLRVWGSYVMGGILDPENSGGYDVKFSEAKGYRIGAGFKVMIVSLNLEYQNLKYGATTLEKIGPFSPGTGFNDVNLTNDTWIVSASMPIGL